ncbi:hypothetical protein [Micromonospora sp. NPDC006431]|uniref:hypothetical protein n=1 Tax=Micromonospora sp. NPDC006431 TaxID=3364235 RepID=UPI0036BFA81E
MASERVRAVAARAYDSATTLVDTNVLLDIFTEDPRWAEWSGDALAAALAAARDAGALVINPIVYAEVSMRFADRTYFPKLALISPGT